MCAQCSTFKAYIKRERERALFIYYFEVARKLHIDTHTHCACNTNWNVFILCKYPQGEWQNEKKQQKNGDLRKLLKREWEEGNIKLTQVKIAKIHVRK